MKKTDITKNRKSGRDKLKQGKELTDLSSDEFKVLLADVADAAQEFGEIRLPGIFRVFADRVLRDSAQHS